MLWVLTECFFIVSLLLAHYVLLFHIRSWNISYNIVSYVLCVLRCTIYRFDFCTLQTFFECDTTYACIYCNTLGTTHALYEMERQNFFLFRRIKSALQNRIHGWIFVQYCFLAACAIQSGLRVQNGVSDSWILCTVKW